MRILFFLLYFFTISTLHAEPTLHVLPEKTLPFSQLQGKWVLINYWASWCNSCLNEIPALNQFYEKYKDKNVALFAVNYDMLSKDQLQFLNHQLHIHYPTLTEDPADALDLGEIRGVPVTFVFNPKGQLLGALYGEQNEASLSRAIGSKLIEKNNLA